MSGPASFQPQVSSSASRFGGSQFGSSRFIETVQPPGARLSPAGPSVTPLGGFVSSALPGAGPAATFYTASRFTIKLLENLGRELGVTVPKDSMEDDLQKFGKYEIRKNQSEWEVLIGAFEKQHDIQLPKLADKSNLLTDNPEFHFRESVYVRRAAFLDAVQRVSLHQPQHAPSHAGNRDSHLNPDNFWRLA